MKSKPNVDLSVICAWLLFLWCDVLQADWIKKSFERGVGTIEKLRADVACLAAHSCSHNWTSSPSICLCFTRQSGLSFRFQMGFCRQHNGYKQLHSIDARSSEQTWSYLELNCEHQNRFPSGFPSIEIFRSWVIFFGRPGQTVQTTSTAPARRFKCFRFQPCLLRDWEMHVHFKVHGQGSDLFGDGMAIWYARDRQQTGEISSRQHSQRLLWPNCLSFRVGFLVSCLSWQRFSGFFSCKKKLSMNFVVRAEHFPEDRPH